jgi:thiol-disulfide isomerase/thioredoxin
MSRYARFAATFLSALLLCEAAFAADLREITEPKKIASLAPANARLHLINVWATWCVPCVEEMPDLRAIDAAFGAEVAVIGVSLDDMIPGTKREKVTGFLDKYAIAFPNAYFTGIADSLGEHYKFDGEIPITIITDRKGKELWRHQGRLDRIKTIAALRDLLRRKS